MAQQYVSSPPSAQITPSPQVLADVQRYVSRPALDVLPASATDAAVVSLRPPQYGLPLAQRVAFLRALVPNNGETYVGFFSSMPTRAGVGGVECVGSGYVRTLHQAWRDIIVGGFVARRANVGEVRGPTLTGDLTISGWGIWSASSGGSLLAFGLSRNSDGTARVFQLGADDVPRFVDAELQFGIQ